MAMQTTAPTQQDINALTRHLRPGMPADELDALDAPSGGRLNRQSLTAWGGTSLGYGALQRPCEIDLEDGVIRRVIFYPVAWPLFDFGAGDTRDEVLAHWPGQVPVRPPAIFGLGHTAHRLMATPDWEMIVTFSTTGQAFGPDRPHPRGLRFQRAGMQDMEDRTPEQQVADGAAAWIEHEAMMAREKAERRQREADRLAAAAAEALAEFEAELAGDPDEAFMKWASSHSAWKEPSSEWERFARWPIHEASPVERDWAADMNWDHGPEPFLWMVRQPTTQRATVYRLCHIGEMSWWMPKLAEGSVRPERRDLRMAAILRVACENLRKGFYLEPPEAERLEWTPPPWAADTARKVKGTDLAPYYPEGFETPIRRRNPAARPPRAALRNLPFDPEILS